MAAITVTPVAPAGAEMSNNMPQSTMDRVVDGAGYIGQVAMVGAALAVGQAVVGAALAWWSTDEDKIKADMAAKHAKELQESQANNALIKIGGVADIMMADRAKQELEARIAAEAKAKADAREEAAREAKAFREQLRAEVIAEMRNGRPAPAPRRTVSPDAARIAELEAQLAAARAGVEGGDEDDDAAAAAFPESAPAPKKGRGAAAAGAVPKA